MFTTCGVFLVPLQLMDTSEVGSSEPTPPPIDHAEEGITPMASGEVNNEMKAGRERSYSTDSSGERCGHYHCHTRLVLCCPITTSCVKPCGLTETDSSLLTQG